MAKYSYLFLITVVLIFGCSKTKNYEVIPLNNKGLYTEGAKLMKNGVAIELRGTDKMSLWDWNYDEISASGMDITRECIDMKCSGDEDLLRLVNLARDKGFVIVLTAFWYDSDAFTNGTIPYPQCQLLGSTPSLDNRFEPVMNKWKHIADLFKNQSDVWFGVWNEPYNWDKKQTASSNQWLYDTASLVDNIRQTGADNIVVVCGNAMGQGHEPFLVKGAELLRGRKNIIFDIHAYNNYWNITADEIETRLSEIKNLNIAPVIIGEFANNGTEPYQEIITACRNTHTSLIAWLWGQYQEPFKSIFESFCREKRNPI